MPIGTIDYVSTLPWNDPMNPWPQYSRLMLSAIDVRLGAGVPFAYDLSYFYPVNSGSHLWTYTSIDDTYDGAQAVIELHKEFGLNTYTAVVIFDGDVQYVASGMQTKGIPAGFVQGNTDWNAEDGDDVNSLSIIADINYLTPWEHRRRWALNG
jgi:hypothetical protein